MWVYARVYQLPKNSSILHQTVLTKAERYWFLKMHIPLYWVTCQLICFASQFALNITEYGLVSTWVCTKTYFLASKSYILKSNFYFINPHGYCSKFSLYRILGINSSVEVLSPQYQSPSAHLFGTSVICIFINHRKKENVLGIFFSKYLNSYLKPHVFISFHIHESN